MAEAAAALVKSAPDAIVTAGPIATRAAQAATKTIAIVGSADDMVEDGLVSSMRHPGSNTTGVVDNPWGTRAREICLRAGWGSIEGARPQRRYDTGPANSRD